MVIGEEGWYVRKKVKVKCQRESYLSVKEKSHREKGIKFGLNCWVSQLVGPETFQD